MRTQSQASFLVFVGTLFLIIAAGQVQRGVAANSPKLVWDGLVSSNGTQVTTSVLTNGEPYTVCVDGVWWYDTDELWAADAQYYTNDSTNSWFWGNYFHAPDNHSFLQVDGKDVDLGDYSPGAQLPNGTYVGHSYSITILGEGKALTLQVVDWVDNSYLNNECKLHVRIYHTTTRVGGYLVDPSPSGEAPFVAIGMLLVAVTIAIPLVRNRLRKS